MADISFYQYLEAAFRHKVYKNTAATSFNYLGYNLPYTTIGSRKGIFEYARKVLPKFYTSEFPNTEEGNLQMAKKVLEKLDKRLDPELNKYLDPATAPAEYEQIIAEAQKESQQAGSTQAPVGQTGAGGMGLPSAPSFSTPRIAVRQTPPPSGGMEGGTGQGTAATNKANIPGAQTTPLQTQTQAPTPPSKPIPPRFNSPAFKSRVSNLASGVQNLASRAGPPLKINLGRIGTGLGNIAKGMGRGIAGPGLSGIANFGGRAGLGALNHGGNFLSNLSNARSRFSAGARSVSPKNLGSKRVLLIFGGIFLAIFFLGALGGIGGTTPSTGAAPITPIGNSTGLDYTLPLKDSSIQPLDIKDQVKAAFPGAKLEYWDKIVQNSITAGFNPALTLSLWIEETGASQTTLLKNGGSEIAVNGNFSKGHLGCAPWEDQTIDESLSCLFKFAAPYSNDQFPQFMAAYSAGPPDAPFSNNPDFTKTIKDWYSKLVPSGPGALTPTSTATPPPPTDENYKKWVQDNLDITINDGFQADTYRWAYEILSTTLGKTTKFKQLLGGGITISPTCGSISHTSGRSIVFKYCPGGSTGPTIDESLFKVTLIHELAHIINGSFRPGTYGNQMKILISQERFLTSYSENSATSLDILCGPTDIDTQADEDFAESVTYYINSGIRELDYGCGLKWGLNPYSTQKYPNHLQFIRGLLGGT